MKNLSQNTYDVFACVERGGCALLIRESSEYWRNRTQKNFRMPFFDFRISSQNDRNFKAMCGSRCVHSKNGRGEEGLLRMRREEGLL